MTDEELRALVREVVGRRMTSPPSVSRPALAGECHSHPSHGRLRVLPGAEVDGPCLIEPAVRCSFCGYCQSYGH